MKMKNLRGSFYFLKARPASDVRFQRAIALSLQEAAGVNAAPIIVSDDEYVDEDTEDAEFQRELRRAIEVSKVEASSTSRGDSSQIAQPQARDAQPATSAFLSERALMEKERLDRQKRLRPDTSFDEKVESSKRQHLSSNYEARPNGKAKGSAISSRSSSTLNIPTIDQIFWEGEVRQVANRHAEPRKDGRSTFRLTEVLGKVCLLRLIDV
jgi:tyrosyl-DNA phosphodiesterase 1